jgi:hypothetical protein
MMKAQRPRELAWVVMEEAEKAVALSFGKVGQLAN